MSTVQNRANKHELHTVVRVAKRPTWLSFRSDMLANPRRPIAQWHTLQPLDDKWAQVAVVCSIERVPTAAVVRPPDSAQCNHLRTSRSPQVPTLSNSCLLVSSVLVEPRFIPICEPQHHLKMNIAHNNCFVSSIVNQSTRLFIRS